MEQTQSRRARFGPFELDLRAGELHGNGSPILLPVQLLQVLQTLVERGGDLVTREEIKRKLWPNDTVVEFDHSINTAIKKLRRALNDSAEEPRYIETIPRRGYRLMVPVEWTKSGDDSSEDVSLLAEPLADSDTFGDPDSKADAETPPYGRILAGRTVSHYRVLEIIGGGGMGVVYHAEDLKLGRAVALKFLPEEVGDDPKARERFEREAKAVSALDHPNICTVYDFDQHEGHPFIAMQRLQGKTLRDHLSDGRFRLAEPEGLEAAVQIAAGLEAAHEKGIIHRDIKPANIFITEKNVAKILDFGVAKVISLTELSPAVTARERTAAAVAEPPAVSELQIPILIPPLVRPVPGTAQVSGAGANEVTADDARAKSMSVQSSSPEASLQAVAAAAAKELILTRPGTKLGTAGYMSPEQIRGEPLDARTDIFSFGLVLYEMATGTRAFTGETEAMLHDAIQRLEPKPVRELAPEIAPKLEEIITKCLKKERESRYQAAWEMANDLRELQQAHLPQTSSLDKENGELKRRRKYQAVTIITVVVLAAIAMPLYRGLRPIPRLTPQRTLVLAEFENKTVDKAFDKTLALALSYALTQTPALNLLSQDKVQKSREALGIAETSSFSADKAMQVCKKTKSSAVLDGSISDSGNSYRIELQADDCATGAIVGKSSAYANDREQVIHSLGVAAHELRRRIGENEESLREFDQPLEIATTSSLEALQMLSEYKEKKGAPETIPGLKRAVELDPQFALAHAALGTAYFDVLENRLAVQEYKAAYELRNRADAYSRLSIEQSYLSATGQLELAIGSLKRKRELYATAAVSNDLSIFYRYLGLLEASRDEGEKAVRETPGLSFAYINLSNAYVLMGRFDQAQHVLDEASASNVHSRWLELTRYWLAFLNRDFDGMQKEVSNAKGHPGSEDLLLNMQANTEAYFGRCKLAHQYTDEAVRSAMKSEKFMAGFYVASAAMSDAEVGYQQRAIIAAKAVIGPNAEPEALKMAGLALARSGEANTAEQIIARLNSEAPLDTLTQKYHIPLIQAAIDIQQKKPAKAVEDLQASSPYELGGTDPAYLYPAYIRGLAYLQLGNGGAATREFRKLLEHPGIVQNAAIGALAHVQLGRAYMMMGDQDAARESYQEFLVLWKDADREVPIYKQAKAEYAKLQ